MTGTCNKQAGDYPVAFSFVDGSTRKARFCVECNETHVYDFAKPSDMLHHDKCSAKMCKPTHVRLTKVYEVSLRMLRLERSCHSVSDWTIDSASLNLALEKSARDRGRLGSSSHAVRNWPLPPIVDFSQSDPPYPGSDFNPDAGTYSGFWEEQDADQALSETSPGDLNLIVDMPTDAKTHSTCDTAVVTRASLSAASQAPIIPPQVKCERVQSTATSPASVAPDRSPSSGRKITSSMPKASMPESSGAGQPQSSSSKSVIDSRRPVLTAQPPVVDAKACPNSEAARTKAHDSDGIFTKTGKLMSNPVCLKEDNKIKPSSSTAPATIDAQQPPRQIQKVPAIKLDPTPAGASITEKALAESSLTKNVVAADSVSPVESAKTQVQTKQPAACSSITRLPADKPTHPFKPGHIVWVSRREYEGENYNPLGHLRDITNVPPASSMRKFLVDQIMSTSVITTFADYKLSSVPLSELKKGNYLAIATANNPNPVCVHKVKMVDGKSMPRDRRVSYINANKRYIAPTKMLDKMKESRVLGDHCLDQDGVKKLKEARAMAVAAVSRL